jgi:hypothetical protein
MNPAWPERIDCGQVGASLQNARPTGLSEGKSGNVLSGAARMNGKRLGWLETAGLQAVEIRKLYRAGANKSEIV